MLAMGFGSVAPCFGWILAIFRFGIFDDLLNPQPAH
jgi:hypothetical protein